MTKIKICGLKRYEDISYVNESRPDYVGFVFAKSRRQVTGEQALKLRERLTDGIVPVGVFVNENTDVVAGLVNDGIIDMAQLHGDESEEYINELKDKLKRGGIIKAVRVKDESDVISAGHSAADYILFDTYSKGEYGGTGMTFDWSVLKNFGRPYFLAGGINSENVEEAVKTMCPYAVDVSSAVETDGVKDRDKIADIIKKVRLYQ